MYAPVSSRNGRIDGRTTFRHRFVRQSSFLPGEVLTWMFTAIVKVRFQDPNTSARYSGTFNAVSTIIREERFSGLYKGIMSPMVCVLTSRILWTGIYDIIQATCALLNGLVFSSYRFLMKAQLSDDQAVPALTQIFFAGAGTGMIGSYVVFVFQYLNAFNSAHSIITTPTELVKIRQQALLTPISTRQMLRRIVQQDGIRGLYRGITATSLRDIGYGSYFFAVSPPKLLRIQSLI